MKRTLPSLVTVALLVSAATLPAQAPTINGYLRYQLGATVDGGEIIQNTATAEVELGYRGSAVDLVFNPYFVTTPDAEPTVGIREAYLDYFTNYVDLRVGKQIIIWGKADGLAVTDIVSPKDLTDFLIPEFRELRRGVVAAQAKAYVGPVVTELVYIPQFSPSVLPEPDSIWFTSLDLPVEPTLNPAPDVGSGVEDGEFYGRLRTRTSLVDVDLAGGYYWTNEPSPTITREFSSPGDLSGITVTPEHYRQWLAGAAISSSAGPFILRAESGYFTPRRFLTTDMTDTDGYVEKDYLQSLAGVDTVLAGVDVSLQAMHQYVIDHEEPLEQPEHSWTITARGRRSFLRDRLVLDAFSYIGFDAPDALVKLGVTWAPADALSLRVEGSGFFGDEGQFGGYDGNDLVTMSTRYSY